MKFTSSLFRQVTKRSFPQNQPVREENHGIVKKSLTKLSLAYLAVVNAGAFALFGYDKYQAQNNGWRVPEKTLQLSALMGGWIGGMAAMKQFHHKTKKESFRQPYFACAGANAVALAAGASVLSKNPAQFQRVVQDVLRQGSRRR